MRLRLLIHVEAPFVTYGLFILFYGSIELGAIQNLQNLSVVNIGT